MYFLSYVAGNRDTSHSSILDAAVISQCFLKDHPEYTKYTVIFSRDIVPFDDYLGIRIILDGSNLDNKIVIGQNLLYSGWIQILKTTSYCSAKTYFFGDYYQSPNFSYLSQIARWYNRLVFLSVDYMQKNKQSLHQSNELKQEFREKMLYWSQQTT